MSVTRAAARGVWWLCPAGAVVLVVPATLAAAVWFDDSHFRSSWSTPKSLTGDTIGWYVVGVTLFVIGAAWPAVLRTTSSVRSSWPGLTPELLKRLHVASNVVFWLTIAGYASLGIAGVARGARPVDLVEAVTRQENFDSPLRIYFAPVTGVTTLTQLGIAYAVLGTVLLVHGREPRLLRRLVLIVALAAVRTFFLSERLATLELAVPVVTVICFAASGSRRTSVVGLVRAAPLLLVPAVVAVFSLLEYSRSWVFYAGRGDSFVSFALDRLLGYYVTAYNNGQLALNAAQSRPVLPYQSIEGVWTAPGVPDGLYQQLTGQLPQQSFAALLDQAGNPEFNSIGGLAVPLVDYGVLGGLVFFVLLGSVVGLVYEQFRAGTLGAVLVYPVIVTGLFEMPRYLYWGQGRVLPALAALLITGWWATRVTRATRAARASTGDVPDSSDAAVGAS